MSNRAQPPPRSHSAKPILFIDVDGVLNPFAVRPRVVPPGFTEHRIQGYRVLLTPRHGEWLLPLAERFDLVWAASWNKQQISKLGYGSASPTCQQLRSEMSTGPEGGTARDRALCGSAAARVD